MFPLLLYKVEAGFNVHGFFLLEEVAWVMCARKDRKPGIAGGEVNVNQQALCSECGSPLPADTVDGLCPRCTWNRRIVGSPRRLGWLLILLGGGWALFWNVLMTPIVVRGLVEASRRGEPAGEYGGYAVMIGMLTIPGLFVLLTGTLTIRSVRKSLKKAPDHRTPAVTREGPRASRSVGWTVMSALTGAAIAFMMEAIVPPILILSWLYSMLGGDGRELAANDMLLAIVSLCMTALGAVIGIIVGRHLRGQ